MKRSSRIAKNQVLRQEREEKEREVERILEEIEIGKKIERKRKREERKKAAKEAARAKELEKKLKREEKLKKKAKEEQELKELEELKAKKLLEKEQLASHDDSKEDTSNGERTASGSTTSTESTEVLQEIINPPLPSSNEAATAQKEIKQQQTVKKKKVTPKFKIKAKPHREEIDISDTSIEIVTVTTAQMRKIKAKSNLNKNNTVNITKLNKIIPKSQQKQLVHIPSNTERSIIYEESAKAVAIRECQALPPHGGRPWKCIITIYDDNGACGAASSLKGDVVEQKVENKKKNDDLQTKKKKKSKRSAAPLFRWFRGKLELACLPHILDQIESIDTNFGLLKTCRDEYNQALDMMKEEEKATDLTCRQITILSTVAWNEESHPNPHVDRKWVSPDHKIFRSRTKVFEHCAMLDDRDKMIDKVLHGIGLRGASIRPVKPTRKQALEAGLYRFLRDGLWVVGQEDEWVKQRIAEFNKREETETLKEKEKCTSIAGDQNDSEIVAMKQNGHVDNICHSEESTNGKNSSSIESKESGNTEAKAQVCYTETKSDTETIEQSKADLKEAPQSNQSDVEVENACPKTTDQDNDREVEESKKKCVEKRKREYHFEPSIHWRLTPKQIELSFAAIMDHYEKITYTIKQRALHSELADGFDVFRQRGKGRYDMQLPAFDTDEFRFLTDLEKASWMPVVKKILGDDATLVHKGAFLSMPGSDTQVYHQDGVHLTTKYQRPCHAINVFIPLVDLCMQNGPTEFCVGTHILGYDYYSKDMIDVPLARAGCPVIFDYRLGHRGLGNSGQSPRPIVYLTYTSASKEFRDSVNFSQKRYRKLGDLIDKPLSRQERALKRAREF